MPYVQFINIGNHRLLSSPPSSILSWQQNHSGGKDDTHWEVFITQLLLGVGVCNTMLIQDTNKNDTKSTYAACFRSQSQNSEPTTPDCVKAFIMYAQDLAKIFNFKEEEINYLWSLERETQSMFYNHHRRKRQAVFLPVRKECRLLSQYERQNLFYAIRSLKMDTSNPNEYDTLANLHRGDSFQPHAHDGSNFLGWHRVYLMYYERALRRRRAGVTLCFWDTTMEFNLGMENWAETAVFSSDFFGNRREIVTTGPFRDWPLPPGLDFPFLTRNLSIQGGMPFDSRAAYSIFYNPNTIIHSTVTVEGFGFDTITNRLGETRDVTIEGEHNNVHNWVGGVMGLLDPAPQDPIFFFHHCYIDYAWERFREKMKRYGRDPTTDYPGHGVEADLHDANYPMIGFEWYRNIDGYSDFFTQNVYRYESPTCQACYNSPYTVCGPENQCIARMNYPGMEIDQGPPSQSAPYVALSAQAGATAFASSSGRRFVATSNSE
ncbi:hypothetical protein FSP39_012053 [Pinctada imbricata]|uniref:Tyrosinase copper-binding domain-containing protein n=1 Tax=Pinctada imbricata TaxID=66713 RepID=A0AA88XKI5_PINIB|nr:hypothetical protein FSP39_012053 [Pinctada imbricata]